MTEQLLPVRGAGRRAREVVTEACLLWDLPPLISPACIAVSELVANGVVHAGTMLTLTVARQGEQLCVAVEDGSPHHPAAGHRP
ncbi:hypothetical protein O7635_24245 [Asanoa sp. WMMD1127]|uniref:hypothetical protein n=1 Tax=Asanoa sp. WMMD1127 TaxID=3016107 RepID=UPI0024170AFC|nr:hypothetical protein [Asanoa sp. WMMD1127]MDG4824971.1 hypothetical protein [Asanoa sp. WMMD1127]